MRHWFKENRGFLIVLLCFGFFRTAIADWNPVPSGSMRPTILEGDVVLVNRLAYDFKLPLTDITLAHIADPQRGDIVTFISPKDGVRLIKRLVAVPGDVVEMHNDMLSINGQRADYTGIQSLREEVLDGLTVDAVRAQENIAGQRRTVQFLNGIGSRRDFGPVTVPANQYFMLGDNRDNSADSRFIGFVSRERLIGRAHHILLSADIKEYWLPRFERFGAVLQ